MDLTWIQSHLLCPKQQLLHGSDRHYFPWSCLELKCDTCFLNKPALLICDRSVFTDPTSVTKWEKWEQLDYTQRNMVVPAILQQAQLAEHDGVPLRYAPEVPKLKKAWVKKGRSNPAVLPGLCWANGTGFHSQTARQVNK